MPPLPNPDIGDTPVGTPPDAALQLAMRRGLGAVADDFAESDIINHQPQCAFTYTAWGSSASEPLRYMLVGDSYSTGFTLGPKMANSGIIGLLPITSTGLTSYGIGSVSGTRFEWWINGGAYEIAVAGGSEWTAGATASGDIIGDRACVAYIKRPGGGAFLLQSAPNQTGNASLASDVGWTTLATIDTDNPTVEGGFAEYALSISNTPSYRLRIKQVAGVNNASVVIVGTGIYNSQGGGVIEIRMGSVGGWDLVNTALLSNAVFGPIIAGLRPNLMVVCFAGEGPEFSAARTTLLNATTTSGSPNIDFTSTANLGVGMEITHANFPAATTVVSKTATTAVLSNAATASGSGLSLPVKGVFRLLHERMLAAMSFPLTGVAMTSDSAAITYASNTRVRQGMRVRGGPLGPYSSQYFSNFSSATAATLMDKYFNVTGNVNTVAGSAIITFAANPERVIENGMMITGTHIPGGATVVSYTATSITMSANATGNSSGLGTMVLSATNTTITVLQVPDIVVVTGNTDGGDPDGLAIDDGYKRAWCLETRNSYINGRAMFGDYPTSRETGMMADVTHLGRAGRAYRNLALWARLPIGSLDLGALGEIYPSAGGAPYASSLPGGLLSALAFFKSIYVRGAAAQVACNDNDSPLLFANQSGFRCRDGEFRAFSAGGEVGIGGKSSFSGWHPGGANAMLGGRGSLWWMLGGAGLRLEYTPISGNYTVLSSDYTVNVTSGSPTVTLPDCVGLNAATSNYTNAGAGAEGRIYMIKNSGGGTASLKGADATRGSGVTNGTTGITFASNGQNPNVGDLVTGTDIPANTYIVSATQTSATLNNAATGSNTGITFTFTETIDGVSPVSLTNGQKIKVQSTGAGWIAID